MDKIRVLFFGTPDFAATCLQSLLLPEKYEVPLVITQPDRPAGRGGKIQCSPVKSLALEHGISLLQPESLRRNLDRELEAISHFGPFDIGVVVAFGQILPQKVLDLPAKGCVNVHASLLPRWRGAAPIQRAILAGDKETGICLMQMDAGLDTGPVLIKDSLAIAADESFGSLHDKLADLGARLLRDNLDKIVRGQVPASAQPDSGATYAAKLSAADARLNWSMPAEYLERQVRALNPFPAAFCMLKGKRLKVFSAVCRRTEEEFSEPGRIEDAQKSTLEVRCAKGILSLGEVQLEGKKRMPAGEFLKGMPLDTASYLE